MKTWIGIVLGCLVLAASGLAQQRLTFKDTDLIPHELVEAADSLGQVIAFNPEYGFIISSAGAGSGLEQGKYVAVRRNGLIVVIGYVEEVTAKNSTITLVNHRKTDIDARQPRIRDEVIQFPVRPKG